MGYRKISFPGNHQTTYSDWGKTVLQNHPNPRFAIDADSGHIGVYDGQDLVAEFFLNEARGWAEVGRASSDKEEEHMTQFMEFDVDRYLLS